MLEAFLSKAIEVNRSTNAVVEFLLPEALEEAQRLDSLKEEERGTLHGIPFSVKVRQDPRQDQDCELSPKSSVSVTCVISLSYVMSLVSFYKMNDQR